ncbi:hypothetical protein FKM82_002581 [Ascaphus truei]
MNSAARALRSQNFHALREDCIKNGKLFDDPEFPASDESLCYSSAPPRSVEWKRPGELCGDPRLLVDGISAHDLHQGKLGELLVVAEPCSCLALKKPLWEKCHVFAHRLAGSYEALDGGNAADAIEDFTGAVTESFDLGKGQYRVNLIEQTKLFEDLLKVHKRGGLISCSIKAYAINDMEAVTPRGLIKGHAYSVTGIRKVRQGQKSLFSGKAEKLFMVRMRNPWGKREWNGAWSDESEEWNKVSESEKLALGLTVRDDGEFWMTFEDWCTNYTHADVCRIINTSYLSLHKTWEKEEARGAWTRSPEPLLNRSGGCFNNKATFLQNPQWKAEMRSLFSAGKKDQRTRKKDGKGDNFIIGFDILNVELNRQHRIHKLQDQEKAASSPYINVRTVFLRKVLKQGRYVVIPTTFQPAILSDFLLRIFTDEPSEFRELLADKPKMTCWNLLCGYPQRVTQVLVQSVEGVQRQRADLYVIIKCERESVSSAVHKNATGAVFGTHAIFYRKSINEPISIQVWDSNVLCDQFLGQVLLAASPGDTREVQSLQLHGRAGQEAAEMPGRINVKVVSSDDLVEL